MSNSNASRSGSDTMAERRVAVRQKSFLKGKLYFDNRRSSVDCVVRDYSASGMRLEFPDSITIPNAVEVYIPSKDETVRAQVRWRKAQETGVEYNLDQIAPDSDLTRRVQLLEREVKALRRVLAEMKSELGIGSDAS